MTPQFWQQYSKPAVICFIAAMILLILFVGYAIGSGFITMTTRTAVNTTTYPTTQSVPPTPVPLPTQQVITFTAQYCTFGNGQYQVYTTDNRILIFPNYDSWNQILPNWMYVGTISNGYVIDTHQLGQNTPEYPSDTPLYYSHEYVPDKGYPVYYGYYQPYYYHKQYPTIDGKCIFADCG
jgi:hypothetical protein